MDVREKLVELLGSVSCNGNGESLGSCPDRKYGICGEMANLSYCVIQNTANHLIANGVTVQEWISVKDRLPEAGGYVVCIAKRNPFSRFMPMVARIEKNGWVNPITEQYISDVTHWMPMPNPPKGE